MNATIVMTVNAIVSIIFGALLIVMPHDVAMFFGRAPLIGAEYIAGLYGAALLGIGVIALTARSATESDAGQAILLGLFVGSLIGLVLVLIEQLQGQGTMRAWINVAIFAYFTLGFGYNRFIKKSDSGGDA